MYSKLKTKINLSLYKHRLEEYIVANGFDVIWDSEMFLAYST